MSKKIFITGTDTDVGKTHVTVGLLKWLNKHNIKSMGIKPIASGSDDAHKLRAASHIQAEYQKHNPIFYSKPIAPHIAAKESGESLSVQRIQMALQDSLLLPGDAHLIEGAGGWLVPLNESETIADLVAHMGWPVILVVGMRLGCLNHAFLTARAIRASGVTLAGWVANFIDNDMAYPKENLTALIEHLGEEPLATFSYGSDEPRITNLAKFTALF